MFTKEEAKQRQNEANERCRRRREARQLAAEPMPPSHERFRRVEAREALGEYTHDAATGFEAARRLTGLRAAGRALFEQLEGRERHVIGLRFGLVGEDAFTLAEVADMMGLSREAVRQIEAKGLRMLRHPSRHMELGNLFAYVRENGLSAAQRTAWQAEEQRKKDKAAWAKKAQQVYPDWVQAQRDAEKAKAAKVLEEQRRRVAANKATSEERRLLKLAERKAYQEAAIEAERARLAEERASQPPAPTPPPPKRPLVLSDFTWKTGD